MDKNHDDQHVKAKCPFQHTFFEKIIKEQNSKYKTKVLKSYNVDINEYDFSHLIKYDYQIDLVFQ